VKMRKLLTQSNGIIQRIESVEQKQIETDKKIDNIFNALENKEAVPKCGVFFDGQIFDAYVLANKIIKSAKNSIVLIDNYIDESVLTMLSKRKRYYVQFGNEFYMPRLFLGHKYAIWQILKSGESGVQTKEIAIPKFKVNNEIGESI